MDQSSSSRRRPVIVMKFGGTSVRDLDRIRKAALKVRQECLEGNDVVVVVSAMAGTTDALAEYCAAFSSVPEGSEHDAVLAAGEQITIGLFSLALQELGQPATSFLGWQIPLRMLRKQGPGAPIEVDADRLLSCLDSGQVAVVAGFQGVDEESRIITLGRGGSDASAVAIASALGAKRCDIYTDVDGIYTADPRIVPDARRLDQVAFEEMLELASSGARVLQTRSVVLAMAGKTPLRVLSSFTEDGTGKGTEIVEETGLLKRENVTGIAHSPGEGRITLRDIPDRPGVGGEIFSMLADLRINIDMIVHSGARGGFGDLTFTLPSADIPKSMAALSAPYFRTFYKDLEAVRDLTKISIIGTGMRTNSGVAAQMFLTLGRLGINVDSVSTSEIKVSVLVASDLAGEAIRALHETYGLAGLEN